MHLFSLLAANMRYRERYIHLILRYIFTYSISIIHIYIFS